jgi:catechol 2,3-dioxygenase-like lactoylglutathione lyase family enzyme
MADDRNWLIDHTGIGVSNIHRSARFYEAALRPLGVKIVMRITRGFGPIEDESTDLGGVAYGIDYPLFWIDVFHPHGVKQHTAFRARSRQQVDAFHEALLAGGIGPACDPAAIRPATMPHSFSIQTATISKRCSEKKRFNGGFGSFVLGQ